MRRELFVVSDDHQRGPGLGAAGEQQLDDVVTGLCVEVAGRLVGEDQRRARGRRAGDGDALLLAA